MKQHLSKVLILSVFTFFLLSPCLSAQAPSPVVKAAQEGLMDFCEGTGNVKLGMGFQVHTVNPLTLIEEKGSTLQALVFPKDMWRFFVLENGKLTGLLMVVKVDQEWKAVSFGGAELAMEVDTITKSWKGHSFRFIRIYQATSDFMEIKSSQKTLGFAPLKSARISLGIDAFEANPKTLLYNSEIVGPLRDMVSKVISTRHQFKEEK